MLLSETDRDVTQALSEVIGSMEKIKKELLEEKALTEEIKESTNKSGLSSSSSLSNKENQTPISDKRKLAGMCYI